MYTQIQQNEEDIKKEFCENVQNLLSDAGIKDEYAKHCIEHINKEFKNNKNFDEMFWELLNNINIFKKEEHRHKFINLMLTIVKLDKQNNMKNRDNIHDSIFEATTNFPQCSDNDVEKICDIIIQNNKTHMNEEYFDTIKKVLNRFIGNSLDILTNGSKEDINAYLNNPKIIRFPFAFIKKTFTAQHIELIMDGIFFRIFDMKFVYNLNTYTSEGIFDILNKLQDIKLILDFSKHNNKPKYRYDFLERYITHFVARFDIVDVSRTEPVSQFIDELQPHEISRSLIYLIINNPKIKQFSTQQIQGFNAPQIKKICKIKEMANEYSNEPKHTDKVNEKYKNIVNNADTHLKQLTFKQKERILIMKNSEQINKNATTGFSEPHIRKLILDYLI